MQSAKVGEESMQSGEVGEDSMQSATSYRECHMVYTSLAPD